MLWLVCLHGAEPGQLLGNSSPKGNIIPEEGMAEPRVGMAGWRAKDAGRPATGTPEHWSFPAPGETRWDKVRVGVGLHFGEGPSWGPSWALGLVAAARGGVGGSLQLHSVPPLRLHFLIV